MTTGAKAEAPIGVFDSGIGGLSILRALRAELPHEDFVYFADTGHAPYGERGDGYVAQRSHAIAQRLAGEHRIKALVVACNTATAAAIHLLRQDHAGLPVVGIEPALKPALALTRTRRIGVLATRGTLASSKFRDLQASLQGQADFVLQPCDGLAAAIEAGDEAKTLALCRDYLEALGPLGGQPGQIDTLVLGCTHYPFAAHHLAALAGPQLRLVETGEPVARQTRRLLEAAGLLRAEGPGALTLLSTGTLSALQAAAARWLSARV